MSGWMTAYAATMAGIVAIIVILAIAGMKRLEKERGRIRDNVHKGGFISAEEFQRDWISMRANGRNGAAGYKYEDGYERRLIDAFHATESYNSTRGGAQRR